MTWLSREFNVTLMGTSFWTHSTVLKDAILVTGKGDARERQVQRRAKQNESEGQRIWSIKIGCATSSIITSSFTLLMILWTFLTPLILIWQLTHYDSHSLEAVSHSSSSQVIGSSYLSIYILFFPWWVTVFCFITHFLSDLSSDSSSCSKMELSGIFLWLIDEQLFTDPECCFIYMTHEWLKQLSGSVNNCSSMSQRNIPESSILEQDDESEDNQKENE